MAGDRRQFFYPVENFIDEWEEEALGGKLTVVQNNILNELKFPWSKISFKENCVSVKIALSPCDVSANIKSSIKRYTYLTRIGDSLLKNNRASPVTQLVKSVLQCRRPGFDPWVGKIPWRRERLPIPVFWCGEFCALYSPWGRKESDTAERISLSLSFT